MGCGAAAGGGWHRLAVHIRSCGGGARRQLSSSGLAPAGGEEGRLSTRRQWQLSPASQIRRLRLAGPFLGPPLCEGGVLASDGAAISLDGVNSVNGLNSVNSVNSVNGVNESAAERRFAVARNRFAHHLAGHYDFHDAFWRANNAAFAEEAAAAAGSGEAAMGAFYGAYMERHGDRLAAYRGECWRRAFRLLCEEYRFLAARALFCLLRPLDGR